MTTFNMDTLKSAASYVADFISGRQPELGIVLGSGLGSLADSIEDPLVLPYSQIPGFPVSTAVGHKGNFIVGNLSGKCVIAMQGRFHFYEGYPMTSVTMAVRVMYLLGVRTLFVSNAAGGINPEYRIGDLMIINDHISLQPNPLIGPNLDELGPRFPDMTRPYDPALIRRARAISASLGWMVHEGVYLGDTGPSYETPAEYRFYRAVGGDVVGMSTIPEVIVARHCGMRVFGMSVVTNEASGDFAEDYQNDGEHVVKAADAAASKLTTIFKELIATL
ncbi:MAG: purine-nucleoside phosphorylase [Bacteroidales bacterium]|nr:purine-nucleoside phosphorylase [Bacteroidales bacterium]